MKPLFLLTPFLAGLYSWVVAPLAGSGMTPGAVLHSSTSLTDLGEPLPDDLQSSDSVRLQLAAPPQHVQVTGVSFLGPLADQLSLQSIPTAISHGDNDGFKVSLDPGNHPGPVHVSMEITTDSP